MRIIGKDGLSGVTARKVAKAMGLKNVSLVNYYFKTKEKLILETLKNNYFDVMTEIHGSFDNDGDSVEKLVAVFDKMLEIFWEFPGLIGLLYFEEITIHGFIKEKYVQRLVSLQKEISDKNLAVIRQTCAAAGKKEILHILFQLRGTILYPPLAKDTGTFPRSLFDDPVERKKYVRSAVNGICGAPTT